MHFQGNFLKFFPFRGGGAAAPFAPPGAMPASNKKLLKHASNSNIMGRKLNFEASFVSSARRCKILNELPICEFFYGVGDKWDKQPKFSEANINSNTSCIESIGI